ncbi:MAG: DUF3320 domain-containing protein [Chlorobiaceae bacterium]|nr:DUF3320 domain-containing protein [Chlorobiaceae bacterium]
MNAETIKRKLLSSRKELLDIGLRNNLINFRPTSKSLQIVDELSEQVLDILFVQDKPMTFLSMPDKKLKQISEVEDDSSTIELLTELEGVDWHALMEEGPTTGGLSKRHVDTKLQTALTEERLFLSLLKIYSEANTYIEEQGVNILFIALGFLHWYEDDSSDKLRKAPLVLLPVEIIRGGALDAFKIKYTGDDLIENLSLSAKLKTDFNIDAPKFDFSQDTDSFDIDKFIDDYSKKITTKKRWKISKDEIHIGFFSFGKFLMFNDLDSEVWPEDFSPDNHPIISKLLGGGFSNEKPFVQDSEHLDTIIQPTDVSFVRDADSSQTVAILEAKAGNNLVIQGPPGTGKSQTITNIIAEFLSQGKTVLFVAEKMAALEVVKRRLDENSLGDAVLELHSHKSNKQAVLKELERTLNQGQPIIKDSVEDLKALKEIRDELNTYCFEVNNPIGKSGVSFIDALGHYLRLKKSFGHLPLLPFSEMRLWDKSTFKLAREKVIELAKQLKVMGTPSDNPLWQSEKKSFSPVDESKLTNELHSALESLSLLNDSAKKLSSKFKLSSPISLRDISLLLNAGKRAAEAPKLMGIKLSTDEWQLKRDSIKELIRVGKVIEQEKIKNKELLIEQAWDADVLFFRSCFINYGNKWWKYLSGDFRKARTNFSGLCRNGLPRENSSCLSLIDSILTYQESKKIYDKLSPLGESLFGAQWMDLNSDWDVLTKLSNWIIELYEELGAGEIPKELIEFLAGHPDAVGLGDEVNKIRDVVTKLKLKVSELLINLEMQENLPLEEVLDWSLEDIKSELTDWLDNLGNLYQVVRLNQIFDEFASLKLSFISDKSVDWHFTAPEFLMAFDLSWYSGLVEMAYTNSESLRTFDNIKQTHLIEKFRDLDQKSLIHAQTNLAKKIWKNMPSLNQPGEMDVIRREINKKRKHLPIRKLIEQAGTAIKHIKPVFMMSPMSIANFLPPGRLEFDVVVFDEASQVKAVDAFGAILRGKQVIVVGDTKQMPPTDFFSRDIELEEEDNTTSDIESILSLFKSKGALERYLSWHYRSRHESLIAVSNVEFYDRKLVVFPSPGVNDKATGLKFNYLPDSIYDRGRSRTNKLEAKSVANAVIEHARNNKELSLGVVAFSVAQRDLIQIEVELLRRNHPELDEFFTSKHLSEPFFIKNLENVQGDERDVIFISIGYGRNESGRIAKEFGPVVREGGERRLNVLISRAKMAMEVFCNFRADELELESNSSHGLRALKHFLKYSEYGELDIPIETGKDADSPFELEVANALRDKGINIELQVGTAGYFIDIAIKHPSKPGKYLLAVECDGAAYHSSRSARDRDRLRQGVLESLGWKFHRIWSTDWFRNPNKELEKLLTQINLAIEEYDSKKPIKRNPVTTSVTEIIRRNVATDSDLPVAKAYEKVKLPANNNRIALHEYPKDKLENLISLIVKAEAPVHEVVVIKRITESFGLNRAGSRIVDAISSAIVSGSKKMIFDYQDGFLSISKNSKVTFRNWSNLDSSEKKIEYVSSQEIDATINHVVKTGYSISSADTIVNVVNLLGFGRATSNISSKVESRINALIASKKIANNNGKLTII